MTSLSNAATTQAAQRRNGSLIALACAAIASLTVLSFLPLRDKLALHTKGRLHFWGHGVIFGTIAFLVISVGASRKTRLFLFAGLLLLGWGIEYMQHVINHEALESSDVLVDFAGVCLGSLLARLVGAYQQRVRQD